MDRRTILLGNLKCLAFENASLQSQKLAVLTAKSKSKDSSLNDCSAAARARGGAYTFAAESLPARDLETNTLMWPRVLSSTSICLLY
jgi:hypothetical protein